jgi:enolase-phosphatase E1
VILLDIEGTTTPIAFVTERLVPYARAHLHAYLQHYASAPHGAALLDAFRHEHDADVEARGAVPAWPDDRTQALDAVEAYAAWLMGLDRKSPALKELQGHIWADGYRAGVLVAEVYPDVPAAFARWRAAGTTLGIFSSGSVLAQQWLFRRSTAGDLTPFLQWYFDTGVGAKREAASYERIARETGETPAAILFISDVTAELDAARMAGMQTLLSLRPGNPPQPPHEHRAVTTFDQIPSA